MPVSHLSITVSHLPSACSFYLSTLQSLGYRFICQKGNQIGLGVEEADFFLSPESSNHKRSSVHLAFAADTRETVDHFFVAAIQAGGKVNERPCYRRDSNINNYCCSVLDLDGNIAECKYRENSDIACTRSQDCSCAQKITCCSGGLPDDSLASAIIQTATSFGDRQSKKQLTNREFKVSGRESGDKGQPDPMLSSAEKASGLFQDNNIDKNIANNNNHTFSGEKETSPAFDFFNNSKTLIVTVLGVAAGAAITYAWIKSEGASESPIQSEPRIYRKALKHVPETFPERTAYTEIKEIFSSSEEETAHPTKHQSKKKHHKSKSHKSKDTIRLIEAPPAVEHHRNSDNMSSYTRTTVRAIEAPPSIASSHRSRRSAGGSRSATYPIPGDRYSSIEPARTQLSRSTRHSRRQSVGALIPFTPEGFALPRSAREIPLPPSREGSRITITVSNPPQTIVSPRSSYRGGPPSSFKKYTTETYVFSPRGMAPEEYSLPPSSRFSGSSYRSSKSIKPEAIELPPSEVSHRSSRSRGSRPLALPPPGRTSFVSRAPSISRSAASASTVKPLSQARLERAMTDIDDNDTVLPSDSISQVSSNARRRTRRSSRSEHRRA